MSLTNNQTFPGDVIITDDLRVNSSTLSIDSDNGRVGINKLSPGQELDVVGNVYTSSNLTVGIGTSSFHVDTVSGRVGIGTTQPSVDFEAFPGVGSIWGVIGRVRLGRSTRYPQFSHIDMTNGDWYAMLQDNDSDKGDVYFNAKSDSETIYFTYLNTALARFKANKFSLGVDDPVWALHVPKPVKWNVPYINLQSPSASFGPNNFHYLNSTSQIIQHYESSVNNILTFNTSTNAITVPTGYKGLYRIYVGISVSTWSISAREFGLGVYNRGSVVDYNEHNIYYRTPGTYSAMCLTTLQVCNEGDEITFKAWATPADGTFGIHYPNTKATMYMVNPLE